MASKQSFQAPPFPPVLGLDPTKPADAAFAALLRTFGLMRRTMQPYFARFGISGSQWPVLANLHRAQVEGGPGLRLTELSERLLIRPPSVTGVVDRLERQGLVARTQEADDQRAKLVSLTPAGRDLVDRVLRVHGEQIKNVLAALSEPEQKELHRLLDRVGTHLEAIALREEGQATPASAAEAEGEPRG